MYYRSRYFRYLWVASGKEKDFAFYIIILSNSQLEHALITKVLQPMMKPVSDPARYWLNLSQSLISKKAKHYYLNQMLNTKLSD